MPVVIAKVRSDPAQLDAVIEVFREHSPAVRSEPGCIRYVLTAGRDVVVVVEHWRDADSFRAHVKGPILAEITAGLEGLLLQPMDVSVVELVEPDAADNATL